MATGNLSRPLAVVTGASSGIGYELAVLLVDKQYDLVIAADDPRLTQAAENVRALGAQVWPVEADLATPEGGDALLAKIAETGRPVEVLCANAGHGLGKGFLEQDFDDIRHVIETNVTGTLYLLHHIARDMRGRGAGRILITGSIAGLMPGTFQAVYNGSKAFIDNFSDALREELKDTGVTVTCLMPGPTDTEFFARAGMLDTKVGQDDSKDDPRMVAQTGLDALMAGEGHVVAGWKNKAQAAIANVTPASVLADQHRKMAEPGSGRG